MWIHRVKYEDYDGNERSRELYFNLTQSEIIKLQNTVKGGIDSYYKTLLNENDNVKIYECFEELVKLAYGKKSPDGENFNKSPEIFEEFKSSMAYDAFMEFLLTTEDGASRFITGIMPAKLMARLNTPEGKKIAAEAGIDTSLLKNN